MHTTKSAVRSGGALSLAGAWNSPMLNRSLRFLPIACTAACYSYHTIEPAAAPPGMDVRARITGAAFDRVAPLLGTFDSRILVGNVVENSNGSMTLEVPNGAAPNVSADVVQ